MRSSGLDARSIVILGAGHDQHRMYLAAKAKGIKIIGVDCDEHAYSRCQADEFLPISTRDTKGILRTLGDRHIDGVVSPATDAGLKTLYEIGKHFHLSNMPSMRAVTASSDKAYFLGEMFRHCLMVPRHFQSHDIGELDRKSAGIGFPLMVKPSDCSGSKGITFVEFPGGLSQALCYAMNASHSGNVIIEEYIEGRHCSAEIFRFNNTTTIMAISERMHTGRPHFVTTQHHLSPDWPRPLLDHARDVMERVCHLLDIENGPVNIDFIIKDGHIVLIEVGARLAGNGMPDLIRASYGYDTYEFALRLALGENPEHFAAPREKLCHSALRVITADSNGVYGGLEGADRLIGHPAFSRIDVFKQMGEPVCRFTRASHKIGYAFFAHRDLEMMKDAIELMQDHLKVKVVTN
jgi:biotin carboxylase